MRKLLLSGTLYLHIPDHSEPLHLETDGSDDGWGAVLFQKIDSKRRVIRMWSHTWDGAFLKKPPYYKEAKAFMEGMTHAKIFAMSNNHPLQVYTDHSPLTWVKDLLVNS